MADAKIAQLQALQAQRRQQIEEQKARIEELKAKREEVKKGRTYQDIIEEILPEGTEELGTLKPPNALGVAPAEEGVDIFPDQGEVYEKSCQTDKNLNDWSDSML